MLIIEVRLREAFSDSPYVSYAKLACMKWVGEQVGAYALEIGRLAGIAGFSGEELDRVLKLTFVGFLVK